MDARYMNMCELVADYFKIYLLQIQAQPGQRGGVTQRTHDARLALTMLFILNPMRHRQDEMAVFGIGDSTYCHRRRRARARYDSDAAFRQQVDLLNGIWRDRWVPKETK